MSTDYTLDTPHPYEPVDHRTVIVAGLAIIIAAAAGLAAELLTRLIGLVTNLAFHSRFDTSLASPSGSHHSPIILVLIPVAGALVVGLMARYGSAAIRGHGIPEVMEKILFDASRIPARILFLKPLSAAIAIGTGGPFGAEGPIIATGGALGSVMGQLLRITADERKTLLAAGAAAGMAATFGSPVSAVLLAVELLLFEYRPRSLVPVALAAVVATGVRALFEGIEPVFAISTLTQPSGVALAMYAVLGMIIGCIAAGITRVTYGIEDLFEQFGKRFRVHWMWWPAIGAVVVGLIGLVEPRTLGVGYDNITGILNGDIVEITLIMLFTLKFVSWAIYLGSGTSGGTLAPLFTIGGGLGAAIGSYVAKAVPALGIDARVAALVGMASIFAGASHALLASVVFAFETTRQPLGLLPLLAGCTASYLISLLISGQSIMTEKLARRGTSVRAEYTMDYLSQVRVGEIATTDVVTFGAEDQLEDVRTRLATEGVTHQGFPVVDSDDRVVGVVTRRTLFNSQYEGSQRVKDLITCAPIVIYDHQTLRDAADRMVLEHIGRLPVIQRGGSGRLVGILSRSDLLTAHAPRLEAAHQRRRVRNLSLRSRA